MMTGLKASVILPVYNQKESLKKTLGAFELQTAALDDFELIVVDDGSDDGLREQFLDIEKGGCPEHRCIVNYIYQKNMGRAAARNAGARNARGNRLIFCDADRIPEPGFVEKHLRAELADMAAVGESWDFFGNPNGPEISGYDFSRIRRFSRRSLYYQKITALYDESGHSRSPIVWASFLVGNSSVSKKRFFEVGGFDKSFSSWGFEHFELAFRLLGAGCEFALLRDCANYHIPHPRGGGYYRSMINSSADQLAEKYPAYHFETLKEYLFGEISLQKFEMKFGGLDEPLVKCGEPVFYKLKK